MSVGNSALLRVNGLAWGVYDRPVQHPGELTRNSKSESLKLDKNDKKIKKIKKKSRFVLATMVTLLLQMAISMPFAAAYSKANEIDNLKLYAHSRIVNYKEFQCFNALITKESRWRVDARNGSHYGLGQMRNPQYRNLDGYRMVDWSIRYITKRYKTPCHALSFSKKHGYH